jgi:hypothetical protein
MKTTRLARPSARRCAQNMPVGLGIHHSGLFGTLRLLTIACEQRLVSSLQTQGKMSNLVGPESGWKLTFPDSVPARTHASGAKTMPGAASTQKTRRPPKRCKTCLDLRMRRCSPRRRTVTACHGAATSSPGAVPLNGERAMQAASAAQPWRSAWPGSRA